MIFAENVSQVVKIVCSLVIPVAVVHTVGYLEAHGTCWRGHKGSAASTGSDVHYSKIRQRHDECRTTAGLRGDECSTVLPSSYVFTGCGICG